MLLLLPHFGSDLTLDPLEDVGAGRRQQDQRLPHLGRRLPQHAPDGALDAPLGVLPAGRVAQGVVGGLDALGDDGGRVVDPLAEVVRPGEGAPSANRFIKKYVKYLRS